VDQLFYVPSTIKTLVARSEALSALPDAPVVPEPEAGRLRSAAAALLRAAADGLVALADRLARPTSPPGTRTMPAQPASR
jgi:hypothetical protein